ncbi:hypothetical protein [Candidatus Nitronereus thalassa]|uniref:Uncharacterized protein n=1 Tax=Candidatus Nitronereus thalassa TaxID=3020898 RepID=A0ABU3K357_9BACT|nr:hypothetical protein [Candidatus Nitronereus thalassa]MDT7040830.1 hypothetical protein [Candidatus Nitronereus thalassa]
MISRDLRQALVGAIRHSNFSRYEVAGRLSELLGREVSKYVLDRWLAESAEESRIPAEAVAPLCQILSTIEPLTILARSLQCVVLEPAQAREMQILKLRIQRQEIDRQLQALEGEVK